MNEAREKHEFDVFLSHNSQDKPAVRALAALLIERGISVWLDEEQLTPGHPWQPLLEKGIKESTAGAVLVGADGLGPWEDEEMQAFLVFAVREHKSVIPVLLPGAPEKVDLPAFLANRTWVDLRAGFAAEGMDNLIWGITGEHPGRKPAPAHASEPIIAVTRLQHGAEHLVGRETELTRLDTAWQDPKTHVVTIVAWGGVGKTALVVEWMARMARDGWRGAERVFDWSFYSQGTREQGAASADTFIAAALEFFGGEEGMKLAASPMSGWEKGAKLAQLVAQRRTLLVLDGLEPLQFPPGPVGGKLEDPALEALLKGLAHRNAGLCLVTTREPVTDLAPFRATVSPEWRLEHLSVEAGADLLFQTGVRRAGNAEVKGNDKELKDAASEVGGHALTLQLLGRYLAKVHNGDVRKRSLVAFQKADAKIQGGHAFRTMGAYETWLANAGEEGNRQLSVLRLLGLFDRPADAGCITALRQEPVIDGLTEPVVGLDDDDWTFTLSNLVECGLLNCREKQSEIPNPQSAIDCHPLIREYFARQLREKNPDAWRAAHRRLYEHLCKHQEGDEPTLEDLQPLYQAVTHGCEAGLYEETRAKVYRDRILRGTESGGFYSWKKLGAFGSDLGAVACFFEVPWRRVSPALTEAAQGWLLNEAAVHLRALGRLTEAVEPMRAGMQGAVKLEDWKNAAIRAGNLSELELTLGYVGNAVAHGVKIFAFTNHTPEWGIHWRYRTSHADALHQAGRRAEAEARLREVENMQAECQPERPLLYSVAGFRYCDVLLGEVERAGWRHCLQLKIENRELPTALGACGAVGERAARTLKIAKDDNLSLLAIALDHLTLGRTALYCAILENQDIHNPQSDIELALDGLRHAGTMHYIPHGLLTRAWLRTVEGNAGGARTDLDEAWEIAERGSMKLFLADIHLYRARLFGLRPRIEVRGDNITDRRLRNEVKKYPWGSAQADLAAARKLIEQCGYHRRDEELADAEEAARNWT
jgi:hypothetical protein